MTKTLKSVYIWAATALLIIIWLPLMAARRMVDFDPALYGTGRLFRKLGKAISRVNPNWGITISGNTTINDRHPYVVVCNHLSQADIPLISNLPWEMKWVAKKELFNIPMVGWMMKLAGDIAVDRTAMNRRKSVFEQSAFYLSNNCSVMFFPEGTRSRNGKLNTFTRGAFEIAIKENIPVLPLVIDGTQNCLPKRSWKFGKAQNIRLKVMDPIATDGLKEQDARELTNDVRTMILRQLMEWRNKPAEEVDNLSKSSKNY